MQAAELPRPLVALLRGSRLQSLRGKQLPATNSSLSMRMWQALPVKTVWWSSRMVTWRATKAWSSTASASRNGLLVRQ